MKKDSWWDAWVYQVKELKPRPNTGSWWRDAILVLLVIGAEKSLLPLIFGGALRFDLISSWLVISSVVQRAIPLSFLILFSTATLETHSGAPRGLYLCVYTMIASLIYYVRPTFSWRHRVPWVTTYFMAHSFVCLFELTVHSLSIKLTELPWTFWLGEGFRVSSGIAFGLLLADKWIAIDANEPVPG